MGYFDAFRNKPFPTYYGENKTAVTEDILFIGLIYAAVIIGFSLLIVIPGYPGKEKILQVTRIVMAMFILSVILLCNFGQEWETAKIVDAYLPYKSGFRGEVKADVKVKIGLRSVNITLLGKPTEQNLTDKTVEKINYNERFSWNNEGWVQGRIGFGSQASYVNQQFRAAQIKGTPYPILWIAEYFTIDGEGIRWGRFYRQAGYYTHILLWTAFPLWLITILLFYMVIQYGGLLMFLTGLFLICGNIAYSQIRNVNQLKIPMADNKVLEFSWGWCFYLNLINGIICIIAGIAVVFIHQFRDDLTYTLFGIDRNNELEEIYASRIPPSRNEFVNIKPPAAMSESYDADDTEDDDIYECAPDKNSNTGGGATSKIMLRKKTIINFLPKQMRKTIHQQQQQQDVYYDDGDDNDKIDNDRQSNKHHNKRNKNKAKPQPSHVQHDNAAFSNDNDDYDVEVQAPKPVPKSKPKKQIKKPPTKNLPPEPINDGSSNAVKLPPNKDLPPEPKSPPSKALPPEPKENDESDKDDYENV